MESRDREARSGQGGSSLADRGWEKHTDGHKSERSIDNKAWDALSRLADQVDSVQGLRSQRSGSERRDSEELGLG